MAQYERIFEKPYEDGYEDLPSQNTPITASTLNDKDAAIEHIEDFLNGNEFVPVPTALADLTDDSTHRLVTDEEISAWNDNNVSETTDNEPYVLRQGKGDMVDMELVGGSFAWNQLVNTSDSSITVPSGHKYILYKNNALTKATSDGSAISVTGGTDKCYDVTQMGGSSFADGITTELFAKYFPNYMNYAYQSGKIESVNVASRKVVGKNLLKVTASSTTLNDVTFTVNDDGSIKVRGTASANTFFYPYGAGVPSSLVGQTVKVNGSTSGVAIRIWHYDGVNTVQSENGNDSAIVPITTTECSIDVKISSGTTVNATIYPMLRLGSVSDATFEPYHIANYPLPNIELRGIPSFVNNKLVYDGDVLKSDGSGAAKFGIVTFNNNTGFTFIEEKNGYGKFYTDIVGAAKITFIGRVNIICNSFPVMSNSSTTAWTNPSQNCLIADLSSINGRIGIVIYGVTSISDLNTYLASKPLVVVYELATPTSISTTAFQNPQRAYPDGTEEFVDYGVESSTRDVSIPVGTNSTYATSAIIPPLEDYTDGATMLKVPISAIGTDESNNDKASQAYAQGDYFYKNGIAKAKTSIASGATFTLGTNYEIKTLAEILKALES